MGKDYQEKRALIAKAVALRYEERASWEAIAKRLGIARSTLQEWRLTDDWKRAEYQKRAELRDEARADSSQVLKEAVQTLYDLMRTSENERIRFMAAQKLIDLNRVDELDEPSTETSNEYQEFLQELAQREKETVALRGEVEPGGLLPRAVAEATERYRRRYEGEGV